MAKANQLKSLSETTTGTWKSITADHGAFRETGVATGRFHLAPNSIDKLKARGFTNEELYKIVAPRRTLARRRDLKQELTASESDRVLRLERISEMADRVFANPEKARRWLRKESRALEGARPIDLLQTETGAFLVEQELHRIDYGMFA
ncbi:type II RES/Xre toxin-antitoxin system antitoxin [Mesorhizobium helmanticense]|uniref:Toxin-antitoxin system, antitoxin component n=1 Tax=Mesorhizobium helmanticense TaxID=1776423 RepID=A0A2T4J3Q5_9HYPH|nr:antitoxin Xre/MbcA/ParS toxin-binding domain-containing protein [Mesorhizobium helmanticense]PTE12531.1 toxin-antitoxin system, antitoxin component [Mesorhizobium helmanticense]